MLQDDSEPPQQEPDEQSTLPGNIPSWICTVIEVELDGKVYVASVRLLQIPEPLNPLHETC